MTQMRSAESRLLAEGQLPSGWRHASGEQHLGRPVICGISLEPAELADVATIRYTRGYAGPFIVHYCFVAQDEQSAAQTADVLAERLPACPQFTEGRYVVQVTALPDVPRVGEGFSAVRLSSDGGVVREVVTFRQGRVVTVLVGCSPADLPSRADLAAVAEAAANTQRGAQ